VYGEYREHRKIIRAFDAYYLNREGCWGCVECGAHNPNSTLYCGVCGNKQMPTTLLSPGPVTTLLQNVVYALPSSRCFLFCDTAAAVLEQSNTLAFTLPILLVLDTNEQVEVAGGFIRCTSGVVLITLKKA